MRLSVEGLAAQRGSRSVFAGLSFSAEPGDLVAVTGPNGSGKSTLLRIIAGLLPPAAGAVIADPLPEEGTIPAHYVGHGDALKPALTVRENLDFWSHIWAGDGLEPLAALERMGLAHLADLPAGVLSAGQKRRVALSRLLLAARALWLLDEPTTALDAEAQARLGGLLAAHRASGGIALVATHQGLGLETTREIALGGRS